MTTFFKLLLVAPIFASQVSLADPNTRQITTMSPVPNSYLKKPLADASVQQVPFQFRIREDETLWLKPLLTDEEKSVLFLRSTRIRFPGFLIDRDEEREINLGHWVPKEFISFKNHLFVVVEDPAIHREALIELKPGLGPLPGTDKLKLPAAAAIPTLLLFAKGEFLIGTGAAVVVAAFNFKKVCDEIKNCKVRNDGDIEALEIGARTLYIQKREYDSNGALEDIALIDEQGIQQHLTQLLPLLSCGGALTP
jgi:hypothetical protein